MKNFYFPTFIALLFLSQNMYGQNLPNSMYFAENEHILYTNGQVSEGLYDEGTLRDFQLWFSQPDFWQQLKNNYATKTDLPATMVVEGDTFLNVGVRFKGQTSYSQTQISDKKSFNITMDYAVDGQNLDGYSTLNLNNAFEDASFMREVAYLHQIRRHVPAAKANFIRLFINGVSWGIYPNVQQLNGDYIEEWFFSNDGTRWRADRPAGTGGGGGGPMWGDGTAGLNYLGADTALYKVHYTLKTANKPNPWDDLVNVCDVLNTTPLVNLETEISEVLDLDRTLWFLASEIAFSDDDSYVFKGRMDYYLYWDPETQRITPLEFDGNSVMKSNATNWGVFYNATKVNYPLLNRLLAVPSIRQRYLAHFRTLVADEMNTASFNALIDQYDALIKAGVQADTKKLYTYAQYNSEKTTLKNFVLNHRNTLLNNAEMNVAGPMISNPAMTSAQGLWLDPAADEAVAITATITSGSGISAVSLFYCPAAYGNFSKTTMYDDGQHQDGAANDGVFGGQIPGFATGTLVRFYLEAAANNAAKTVSYLPVGAEHDVFYYNVGTTWVPDPPVVINEVMASNTSTAVDEAGQYEDWIELHNLTDQDLDLSGYALSDNPANLRKWEFPTGTSIPAQGYLIVWADEDGDQGPLHTSFKLSASGETLSLVNPQTLFLDNISFDQQTTDKGYARLPNGTGPFVIQEPTFGAFNGTVPTIDLEIPSTNSINISPNPTHTYFNIDLVGENIVGQILVTDALGQNIIQVEAQPNISILVADWPTGVYFLKWGNEIAKLVVN
ncbi:MAG: CotH kinase family protein [Saprospiraceae bacterium]